jgi:hypothetical protein
MRYLKEHSEFINEGLEEAFDTKYFVMSDDEETIYSDFKPVAIDGKSLNRLLVYSFSSYNKAMGSIRGRKSHYETLENNIGDFVNRPTDDPVKKLWYLAQNYIESNPKVVKYNLMLQKDTSLNI